MFTVNEDWEISDLAPFGFPSMKLHDKIEISLNMPVILLDWVHKDEDYESIKEFAFQHTGEALRFISDNECNEPSLCLMLPRILQPYGKSLPRKIVPIQKIYKCEDEFQNPAHLFILENGEEFIDSISTRDKAKLSNLELVYFDRAFQ